MAVAILAAEQKQSMVGRTLGHYRVVSLLGSGGMGEVYRATDTRLDRTVAVKVLPQHHSSDPERRQRFEREARAVSSLSHPHICALYDVGQQDGLDYLVMEYIEGESLADRLAKGPLPVDQALRCAIQVADALDKAHRARLVHRDLKPANIMLSKSGAKLLDFGLAKLRASDSEIVFTEQSESELPTERARLTREGTIAGTLQYMAPEQLEAGAVDARTDIFSFGAVLYEMITGRKAFSGKSQASLIAAILSSEPQPVSTVQLMSPPTLDRVVSTCLAKDPDERWQTAHDLMLELKWVAEAGSEANTVATIAVRGKNRERLAWIAATAVLLALIVALPFATGYFRRTPTEVRPTRLVIPPP
jgi:serine/threonine protein kinase